MRLVLYCYASVTGYHTFAFGGQCHIWTAISIQRKSGHRTKNAKPKNGWRRWSYWQHNIREAGHGLQYNQRSAWRKTSKHCILVVAGKLYWETSGSCFLCKFFFPFWNASHPFNEQTPFINPLNPRIKIWIIICCLCPFPKEVVGRS